MLRVTLDADQPAAQARRPLFGGMATSPLPGGGERTRLAGSAVPGPAARGAVSDHCSADRKSTRLNSSHITISYAVFCLKKKKSGRKEGMDTQRTQTKSSAHDSILCAAH